MEDETREGFEIFKGNLKHKIRRAGFDGFLLQSLQTDEIVKEWRTGNKLHALYTVCAIDYICEVLGKPYPEKLAEIRKMRLARKLYPLAVEQGLYEKAACERDSLEVFKRHNIMEPSITDVV